MFQPRQLHMVFKDFCPCKQPRLISNPPSSCLFRQDFPFSHNVKNGSHSPESPLSLPWVFEPGPGWNETVLFSLFDWFTSIFPQSWWPLCFSPVELYFSTYSTPAVPHFGSDNNIGVELAVAMAEALKVNTSLTTLRLGGLPIPLATSGPFFRCIVFLVFDLFLVWVHSLRGPTFFCEITLVTGQRGKVGPKEPQTIRCQPFLGWSSGPPFCCRRMDI